MLNRRFLRIKVLQALYSYLSAQDGDLTRVEKQMFTSVNQFYNLYLYLITLVLEVFEQAKRNIERNKEKKLPTQEDLNPNTKFIDNRIIEILNDNIQLTELIENKKINWAFEQEEIRNIWFSIKKSDSYRNYIDSGISGIKEDRKIVMEILRKFLMNSEFIQSNFEEKNMHWPVELELAEINVSKLVDSLTEDTKITTKIIPELYKDIKDDTRFCKELLRKSIANDEAYETEISEKTKNWDVDRIAKLDIILLKMALAEFEHFTDIPVKVTMNEYIELSKGFSTPKSKGFINGILDKFVAEWKANNRIRKIGRGLID